MECTVEAISEAAPGKRWEALFKHHWQAYRHWFLSEGHSPRPLYLTSKKALRDHMPELIPTYERLVELAGGGDMAARFLTLYCPPAYMRGCTQAVWSGPPSLLVRNYDYSPQLFEGTIMRTAWNGRVVMGTGDCLWGLVDGINEDGLAVSLSFGGRRVVGEGFGVPLLLRYVLEFCSCTADAVETLCRVPTHMAYNITVLDRTGAFRTVQVSPDREPQVQQIPYTTNHQGAVEWHQHARATRTIERERTVMRRLEDFRYDPGQFIQSFLMPPLHSRAYRRGFGTLYTAVYRPNTLEMEYLWPDGRWWHSIDTFEEGTRVIDFPQVPSSLELFH